ncbi:MAG TPA: magnesium-translocating P-type ATPase, partial [Candidatus Acidoferrales bacterium]|nr:magnesium-translocating P-type ATPase [Candidatus Acidoferrales bacterium]
MMTGNVYAEREDGSFTADHMGHAALDTALESNDMPSGGDQLETGLARAEAERRLVQFGPNEPVPAVVAGPLFQFLRFCANPLVLILLVASTTSALLGQVVDAIIIAAMVVLSVVLNFIQAYRSERAVQRLRDQVAPTASVKRDGSWLELPRRQLVPGDIVRLSAGDLVPADGRLIRSQDLHVHQAALTGESMPVEKFVGAVESDANGAARHDLVFLGTSIVSGTATALVIATGPRTSFGDIAAKLSERPPETEFDRGTRQFGILILKTVFFLVLFILVVSLAMHRDALESLLFAVALAVGLTPEFLPMITTVTLSMGALKMARRKVIVKHLDAIENLGSIDLLCSDKTGTLTSGAMELDSSLDPFGEPSGRAFMLGYLNSRFESGIKSPLDASILKHPPPSADECEKTDEIPFDFERRRLSIVVRTKGVFMFITKGAPEGVLAASTSIELGGECRALGPSDRERCAQTFRSLSAGGLRVLAVAYRQVERGEGWTRDDERDLVFVGFLTFLDPAVEGVAETIVALRADGVAIKILTGDNELVTRHVCEGVGIDCSKIVLGAELERMTDSALFHVAEEADVFARVSPGQKNRIIRALKGRGHVVGFLGDGINDAPSLHAADVGISVAGAVDVAKDAADIILLEHALSVLHNGIVEGRKAFGNVLKYILMGTSSNFGNMFSMAAAALFLPFLPMLPTQILLNNFLYDLAQVTIPTDNVDPVYIQSPQKWNVRIIRNFMMVIGPISSIYDFLTFYILLAVFRSSEAQFHTGWFVESLATQTLVLFVIRTAGRPWSNRPSLPLASTTIMIVAVGLMLPLSPLAGRLGFVLLPAGFFAFLAIAVVTYLILVEIVKARLVR